MIVKQMDSVSCFIQEKDLKKKNRKIIRVGVVQFKVDDNFYKEENGLIYAKSDNKVRIRSQRFLDIAKNIRVNILCSPELSTTENISKELKDFADENNIIILDGSFYNKKRKNTSPIIIPGAENIYYTEKVNSSPLEKSKFEDQGAVRGEKIYVIKNSGFGSFAVLICSDFLDDEIKNRIYSEDIDFLFVISINRDWVGYHTDMNRDCIKNKKGIYIVYSNSLLTLNKEVFGNGKSAIFGIMDNLYLDKDEHPSVKYKLMEIYDENIIVADFDIEHKKPTFPRTIHTEPNIKLIYPPAVEKRKDVLRFLNAVGLEDERYRRIEDLYVEPTNYLEISEKLREEKIIFLIGDAEIGKTYTSIVLLLDSYKEGYEPIYYKEREPERQFEAMSDKLKNVIRDKTAVYFEDPWGKTEFKTPEHIFRDIGELIDRASEVDTRVIITSREKIFKKFEEKKETAKDLWQHVEKLKINIAYHKENLKEILKNYLKVFKPRWCNNEKLKKIVLDAIDDQILKTPMSIKKLMYSHRAKETMDYMVMMEEIVRAAEETKIAFGKEVIAMFENGEYEKVVFLGFPYISDGFELNFIEYYFNRILEILNKKYNFDLVKAKGFKDVLEFFRGDEVEVYLPWKWANKEIKFSHPSYFDGFSYSLKSAKISKNIYSELLKELINGSDSYIVGKAALASARDFKKLPADVQELLKSLTNSERSDVRRDIAFNVAFHFEDFPLDVREELLRNHVDDRNAFVRKWVVSAILRNFEKIPYDLKNSLMSFTNDKVSIRREIASCIGFVCFEKLPHSVREELLIKLVDDESIYVRSDIAYTIKKNVKELSSNVKMKLLNRLIESKYPWDQYEYSRITAIKALKELQT